MDCNRFLDEEGRSKSKYLEKMGRDCMIGELQPLGISPVGRYGLINVLAYVGAEIVIVHEMDGNQRTRSGSSAFVSFFLSRNLILISECTFLVLLNCFTCGIQVVLSSALSNFW